MPGVHFLKDGVAAFDAPFFNITTEEATALDPRHRLLLECAFETLENGDIPTSSIAGRNVGFYVGDSLSHYELHSLQDHETTPRLQYLECLDSLLGNRLSYIFDLRRLSATIDTACSSSFAALHFACQSLRTGETGQVLAEPLI
jgi:acyl transferase domain-containing protein